MLDRELRRESLENTHSLSRGLAVVTDGILDVVEGRSRTDWKEKLPTSWVASEPNKEIR